jgi:glucan biosynthesis protein C
MGIKMINKDERINYIDRIKVLLCLLVIALHASVAYGGAGSWYYNEQTNSVVVKVVFTIFDAICQSFFMGLFFFISAYFTPASYNKKGAIKFLKDRLLRLGIPLLFFYFILSPTTIYTLNLFKYSKDSSYLNFLFDCIVYFKNLGTGPLWFVLALMIFSIIYILWRNLFSSINSKKITFPKNKTILAFIILLGVLSFAVRLVYPTGKEFLGMQLGYFPQYILLFGLGIVAYENNWLEQIISRTSDFWVRISFICVFIIIVALLFGATANSVDAFTGGFYWQAFVYAMWEPFMCVGISLKLLTSFREKYNTKSNFWSAMALSSYPVYIIHAPISVLMEGLLIKTHLHPFIKFSIVFLSVSFICFTVSHYVLRRLPILKKII